MREVFVHEATIDFVPGADERAPGGAVTVELCGHWEHAGVCRWPHRTEVDSRHGESTRVRVVFACEAADEPVVRRHVVDALNAGRLDAPPRVSSWTTTSQQAAVLHPSEQELAIRLAAT